MEYEQTKESGLTSNIQWEKCSATFLATAKSTLSGKIVIFTQKAILEFPMVTIGVPISSKISLTLWDFKSFMTELVT